MSRRAMAAREQWADRLAQANANQQGPVTDRTIANPSAFVGGSPGYHRYWSEEQPPIPANFTPDPGSQPGGPPAPQPSLQVFPPWERPPKGAQLFQPAADTTSAGVAQLPAGAGAQITIPGLSYSAPSAMISVVKVVQIFVNNPDTTFNVNYWVRQNGQPLTSNAFRTFGFVAGALIIAYEITIRDIPAGATIDMLIVNQGAGGPWTVGGAFSGWSYTQNQEAALTGGLPN
jgi:hypothetical protein